MHAEVPLALKDRRIEAWPHSKSEKPCVVIVHCSGWLYSTLRRCSSRLVGAYTSLCSCCSTHLCQHISTQIMPARILHTLTLLAALYTPFPRAAHTGTSRISQWMVSVGERMVTVGAVGFTLGVAMGIFTFIWTVRIKGMRTHM